MKAWVGFASCVAAAALCAGLSPSREDRMASAANAFLASLGPELRAKASFAFADQERFDWHYVPRERKGVGFGELSAAQRAAADALVASALSSQGVRKVEGVLALEGVLFQRESRPGAPATARDSRRYAISVFGDPGVEPWGWRLEGHHLSLNFTSATGELVATTPSFLGANPARLDPAEIDAADGALEACGGRVLGAEEDLARALLDSLTNEQRERAVRADTPPDDIVLGPGREASFLEPAGIAASALSEDQSGLLSKLLEEYARSLQTDLAERELARIRDEGPEKLFFLWVGDTTPGKPHYYRVQGAHFAIEYDCVRDGANHVHTVWRDFERDFGRDLLREHVEHEHGGR